MRLLVALLVALAAAGCGAAGELGGPAASSGEGQADTVPATATGTDPATATDTDPAEVRPPAIVLESEQGRQEAVQGSYCIEYEDLVSGYSQGACGDSAPVDPKEVTAVAAGDEVSFELAGAEVVSPDGCHSDDPQACIGSVHVRPLGCDEREVAVVPLTVGRRTDWVVDLEPGAYQLDVFGYFESDEGATGDVSGTLGLTVAGAKQWDALGVFAVEPSMRVCPG